MTDSESEAEVRFGTTTIRFSLWAVVVMIGWLCAASWWLADLSHQITEAHQELVLLRVADEKTFIRMETLLQRLEVVESTHKMVLYRLDELDKRLEPGGNGK